MEVSRADNNYGHLEDQRFTRSFEFEGFKTAFGPVDTSEDICVRCGHPRRLHNAVRHTTCLGDLYMPGPSNEDCDCRGFSGGECSICGKGTADVLPGEGLKWDAESGFWVCPEHGSGNIRWGKDAKRAATCEDGEGNKHDWEASYGIQGILLKKCRNCGATKNASKQAEEYPDHFCTTCGFRINDRLDHCPNCFSEYYEELEHNYHRTTGEPTTGVDYYDMKAWYDGLSYHSTKGKVRVRGASEKETGSGIQNGRMPDCPECKGTGIKKSSFRDVVRDGAVAKKSHWKEAANVHVRHIEDANGDLVDIEYFHGYHAPADAGAWPAHEAMDYPVYCSECEERIDAIGLTDEGRAEYGKEASRKTAWWSEYMKMWDGIRYKSSKKAQYQDDHDWEEQYRNERFRDPGGDSALHPGKQRHPCPTCKRPDMLTDADVRKGYQCDYCADAEEGNFMGEW